MGRPSDAIGHAYFPASFGPHVLDERRQRHRPTTGARKACPACAGVMRFFERYTGQHAAGRNIQPAWVCACGYERYVRKPQLQD